MKNQSPFSPDVTLLGQIDHATEKAYSNNMSDRVRSSDIQKELRVELLLLCIKRSQLRRFRHLIRVRIRCGCWGDSRHVQLEVDPRTDLEHTGEITNHI